jgi:hypothetical protein
MACKGMQFNIEERDYKWKVEEMQGTEIENWKSAKDWRKRLEKEDRQTKENQKKQRLKQTDNEYWKTKD